MLAITGMSYARLRHSVGPHSGGGSLLSKQRVMGTRAARQAPHTGESTRARTSAAWPSAWSSTRCAAASVRLVSRRAGYLAGSVLGILVLRLIQTLINCPGTLNSWSTKIVIGLLLRVFMLLLRRVFARGPRRRQHARVTR